MTPPDNWKELITYNPETGDFVWSYPVNSGRGYSNKKIGAIAGMPCVGRNYIKIIIGGKQFYAHRLAWLWVHGEYPDDVIDHVNGDGSDNRICNLRSASKTQNQWNRSVSKRNSTGLKGVYFHRKSGKFQSMIKIGPKSKYLGMFDSPDAAHSAYITAAKNAHGEFYRSHDLNAWEWAQGADKTIS